MDLTGKPFETSDGKKTEEKLSTLHKKTVEREDSESNKLAFTLLTARIKIRKS